MAERHGIYVSEIPFTPIADAAADTTIPLIIGTAPINLSTLETAPVNVPILASSFDEFREKLGYSSDWESFTLCEYAQAHYELYRLGPAVFINVLDPAEHTTIVAPASLLLVNGVATIPADGVLRDTVSVTSSDGSATYVRGTDYNLTANRSGRFVVSRITTGAIGASDTVRVGYTQLDASAVTALDIVGGVDATTGRATGLELINSVFPMFRAVPSIVAAPGYSQDPTVASLMVAKARNINGHFSGMAVTDIPANIAFMDAPDWKADNEQTASNQIVAYPKARNSSPNGSARVYHMSTHIVAVMCATDGTNGGAPSVSPSNKQLFIDAIVMEDGTELTLGLDQANTLGSAGIVTAINFVGGWRAWGNRTAAYPETTDPQTAFIPVRRMFQWIGNQLVLRYWDDLDAPILPRLVTSITDDANIWMNGLTASGYILGGRVEFLEADNSAADLANGKLVWRVYQTPPSPGQDMSFLVAYDAQYLSAITAG